MLKRCTAVVMGGFFLSSIALADGDVPYVPTADETVRIMLEAARVSPGDYLIDLGSGDGRIVIAAAKEFGARALGVDLNPDLVKQSKGNADKAGVKDKVEFRQQDLFDTDLSKASVLTIYLLPAVNLKLREKILSEMKPGARIVSHDYDMGDWEPDVTIETGDDTIYLWVVPARVDGKWSMELPGKNGNEQVQIDLSQNYQMLSGQASSGGQSKAIPQVVMQGDLIALEIAHPKSGQTMRFLGKINGSKIEGVLDDQAMTMSRTSVARAEP